MCETDVAHNMSSGPNGTREGRRMEKIDVRVPAAVLEAIDEEYSKRGYTSRSEAIRDALRDWLDPSPKFSDNVLEDLEKSREQREQGKTLSSGEVRDLLDNDDPQNATEPETDPCSQNNDEYPTLSDIKRRANDDTL